MLLFRTEDWFLLEFNDFIQSDRNSWQALKVNVAMNINDSMKSDISLDSQSHHLD